MWNQTQERYFYTTAQPGSENETVYHLSSIVALFMANRSPSTDDQDIYRALFIAISVIGVCSNFLICFVFLTRASVRSARNIYIANLSLGNLLLSITLVPFIFEPQMLPFWPHNRAACKFFNAFSGMNVYCSTFSTIAIAADRYSTIRRRTPSTSSQLLSSSLYCLLIWIISTWFVTPLMVYCDTMQVRLNLTELRADFVILGAEGRDEVSLGQVCNYTPPEKILILLTCTQVLFLLPVPLICLSVLNYLVHSFLRQRQHKQRALLANSLAANEKQKKNAREHRRVTILLFLMVGSLAVVYSPFHVVTILADLKKFPGTTPQFKRWDLIFQLLSYTSLFINPILYGFLNHNYNREIRLLLRCLFPCLPIEKTKPRAASGSILCPLLTKSSRCRSRNSQPSSKRLDDFAGTTGEVTTKTNIATKNIASFAGDKYLAVERTENRDRTDGAENNFFPSTMHTSDLYL